MLRNLWNAAKQHLGSLWEKGKQYVGDWIFGKGKPSYPLPDETGEPYQYKTNTERYGRGQEPITRQDPSAMKGGGPRYPPEAPVGFDRPRERDELRGKYGFGIKPPTGMDYRNEIGFVKPRPLPRGLL
jgi:hypothetical protein